MGEFESWLIHDKWDEYEKKTAQMVKCIGYLSQLSPFYRSGTLEEYKTDGAVGEESSIYATLNKDKLIEFTYGSFGPKANGGKTMLSVHLFRLLPGDGTTHRGDPLLPCEDYMAFSCGADNNGGTLYKIIPHRNNPELPLPGTHSRRQAAPPRNTFQCLIDVSKNVGFA